MEDLTSKLELALLKPELDETTIIKKCIKAIELKIFGVCVPTYLIPKISQTVGSSIKIISVVGFPLGYSPTEMKVKEAEWAVRMGASEIDMVANISALKSQKYSVFMEDVRQVVESVYPNPVKVIIEIGLLNEIEVRRACQLIIKAEAQFVKTCTGFGPRGVTIDDIKLLKSIVGGKLKIKAAGGIKTIEQAKRLVEAGAHRIGSSSAIEIAENLKLHENPVK